MAYSNKQISLSTSKATSAGPAIYISAMRAKTHQQTIGSAHWHRLSVLPISTQHTLLLRYGMLNLF